MSEALVLWTMFIAQHNAVIKAATADSSALNKLLARRGVRARQMSTVPTILALTTGTDSRFVSIRPTLLCHALPRGTRLGKSPLYQFYNRTMDGNGPWELVRRGAIAQELADGNVGFGLASGIMEYLVTELCTEELQKADPNLAICGVNIEPEGGFTVIIAQKENGTTIDHHNYFCSDGFLKPGELANAALQQWRSGAKDQVVLDTALEVLQAEMPEMDWQRNTYNLRAMSKQTAGVIRVHGDSKAEGAVVISMEQLSLKEGERALATFAKVIERTKKILSSGPGNGLTVEPAVQTADVGVDLV